MVSAGALTAVLFPAFWLAVPRDDKLGFVQKSCVLAFLLSCFP
jgi:hypothetical protein